MGLPTPARAGVFCECLCYEYSQKTDYGTCQSQRQPQILLRAEFDLTVGVAISRR